MKKNKNQLPALEQAINNLPEIHQKYFKWLKSWSKTNTIKTYYHNLMKAEQILGKPTYKCCKDDLIDMKATLNNEEKWLGKSSTAKGIVNAVRSFIAYCLDENVISTNPIPRKFSFPTENKVKEISIFNHHLPDLRKMMADQSEYIQRSVERYGGDKQQVLIALKKRLAVNMLIDLGCRLGELLSVTRNDVFEQIVEIDGAPKTYTMCRVLIHKKEGKDPRTKVFPLSFDTVEAFNDYMKESPADVKLGYLPIFLVKERQMQRYIEEVKEDFNKKIKDTGVHFTSHDFRHLFSTRLGKANISSYFIQKFMGHANIQSPSTYMHVDVAESISAFEQMNQCMSAN